METLDYDHNVHTRPDAGDASLFVHFYMGYLQNEQKTASEGRPIFDDVEFVKIHPPGDRTNIVNRPVRPQDKQRFARQYAQFKQNQEQRATGTPLTEWPIVSRAMAEELKYLGFSTVEQVAEGHDGAMGKHMGLMDLKIKAKQYLEMAKGNTKPLEELNAKLEQSEANNRQLQAQMDKLISRLDEMVAAQETAKSPKATK